MQNIENIAAQNIGKESLAAQSAIKILRIVAFLDHVNIPKKLFEKAAENYIRRYAEDEVDSLLPLSIRCLDCQTLFSRSLGGIEVPGWHSSLNLTFIH